MENWKSRATKVESTNNWKSRASTVQEPHDDVPEWQSALRGLAQGVSLGYADELSGAVESALTDKTYEQARDESRKNFDSAREANPMTYGASQLGGAIATGFIPGLGEMNIAKAAALGATQALGDSTATDAKGMAIDSAVGGALGAGSYKALEAALPLVKSGVQKLSDFIPDNALSKVIGKSITNVSPEQIDRYIANPNAVNSASSMDEIAQQLLSEHGNDLQKNLGNETPSVIQQIRNKGNQLGEDAWASLSSNKSPLSKEDLLSAITSQRDGLLTDGVLMGQQQRNADRALQGFKNDYSLLGDEINEKTAKSLIQNLDSNIDWNNTNDKISNQKLQELRNFIDSNLKSQNTNYADVMNKSQDVESSLAFIKKQFQNRQDPESLNKFFAKTKNIENKSEQSDLIKAFNKIKEHTGYDLQDEILNTQTKDAFNKQSTNGSRNTLLGSLIGGPIGAAVGYVTDKSGGQIFKGFLDGTVKVNKFQQTVGSQLGKFAQPLIEASQRGPQALAASHFLLQSRYPEYREKVKAITGEE